VLYGTVHNSPQLLFLRMHVPGREEKQELEMLERLSALPILLVGSNPMRKRHKEPDGE